MHFKAFTSVSSKHVIKQKKHVKQNVNSRTKKMEGQTLSLSVCVCVRH